MDQSEQVFVWGFPFFFVALWLAVSTLLGVLSGWFQLQKRFPDRPEIPLLSLHRQSGSMGLGVGMGSVLTLSACPTGLRVAIWRLFGPFQKPFFVPWEQLRAEPVTRIFAPMAKLSFGLDEVGKLTTDRRSWQRLVAAAGAEHPQAVGGLVVPPISEGKLLTSMLMHWAAITAFAGAFFYLASRVNPHFPGLPLPLCLGFPAVVFGVPQASRYLMQRGRGSSKRRDGGRIT